MSVGLDPDLGGEVLELHRIRSEVLVHRPHDPHVVRLRELLSLAADRHVPRRFQGTVDPSLDPDPPLRGTSRSEGVACEDLVDPRARDTGCPEDREVRTVVLEPQLARGAPNGDQFFIAGQAGGTRRQQPPEPSRQTVERGRQAENGFRIPETPLRTAHYPPRRSHSAEIW